MIRKGTVNRMRRMSRADLEKEKILNPKKAQERRKKRKRNALLAVFGSLSGVLLLLCGSVWVLQAMGKANLGRDTVSAAPDLSAGQTAETEEESQWQEGWIRYQNKIYAYNDDILTFLIMGIDKNAEAAKVKEGTNGGQADTLFLAVLNPDTETVQIIGLNRNTMTDIDVYDGNGIYISTVKAQLAVQHGFGDGVEKSCSYQVKAVSRLMYDLPIHGYAAVNMSGIPAINDAVGGVKLTVMEDLTKEDPALAEGQEVRLAGEQALTYVRYRRTDQFASSDRRLTRQKQYLTAWIDAARKMMKQDITSLIRLYEAIRPAMTTGVTIDEALYLASMAADYRLDENAILMLEGETRMGEEFEEFYVDEASLYKLIIDVFYEEVG